MQLMTEPHNNYNHRNSTLAESNHYHTNTFGEHHYQSIGSTRIRADPLSAILTSNDSSLASATTSTLRSNTSIPSELLETDSYNRQQHQAILHESTASPNLSNNNNLQTANANMNIQPSSYTKNHLINNNGANLSANDDLSIKKRREDLSRRPSYRKIFNDLTGLSSPLDPPPPAPLMIGVGQLMPPTAPSRQSPQQSVTSSSQQQAANSSPSPQALDLLSSVGVSAATVNAVAAANLQDPTQASQSPVSVVDLQTGGAAATQLAQQQLQQQHSANQQQQASQRHHHLRPQQPQTNTATTTATNHLHQQQQHHHHQQHHQQPHHHHHHHHHQQQQQQQPPPPHHQQQSLQHQQHPQAAPQHPQLQQHHQILTATSPPITGNVVASEEANKKRELRLQKNREAAKECRRKKKEYIKCLENRVAVLENQNKALIDELKTLKDLYCNSANE